MDEDNKVNQEAEQSRVKKLLSGLNKVIHGKGFSKAQDETLAILNKMTDSFKTALAAIDKFLESKGIHQAKLLERAEKLGEQARARTASAKEKFSSLSASVKEKGFKNFVNDTADSVKTKVQDKYKEFTEKANGPPGERKSDLDKLKTALDKAKTSRGDSDKKSVKEKILEEAVRLEESRVDGSLPEKGKESLAKVTETLASTVAGLSKTIESLKESVSEKLKKDPKEDFNKREAGEKTEQKEQKESALVRFRKALKRNDDRTEARKKEIEEEKKNARSKKDGKKGGGFLSKIFKGISGAMMAGFRLITGVIGPMLGRLIGKSIMGVFTTVIPKLIPGLAGGLGKAMGSIGKAALRTAVPLAWGGVKLAAGFVGKAALGAAAAIGGTGLAVIAGTALAIYGGYKLYKYLKRNDVSNDVGGKLTRLRLLTYGYNDVKKEHYHRLFDLEMLMKDHAVFKNGRIVFTKMDNKTKDEILKIFEITRDEKEKVDLFNSWYQKRFLPSYVAFMTALWGVRPDVYLDDLEKLSEHNVFNFGAAYRLPVDAIEFKSIPTFEQPESTVTRKEVDDMITSLRLQAKTNVKDKDVDTKRLEADNKDKASQEKRESDVKKKTDNKPLPAVDYRPSKDLDNGKTITTEDTEPKPEAKTFSGSGSQSTTPSAPTPKMATGPLEKGDKSLTGLSPNIAKEKIYSLEPNVLDMLSGMGKEYNNLTGKSIPINDAFRSYEEQAAMKRKYGRGAASPGSSVHEYGMGIDVQSQTANELDKLGLMKKYGFTRPIGGETWHLEPAGVSINPKAAKTDPADRLKRILASPGRGGGGFGTVSGSPKGRRDMELQKKIFMSAGEEVKPETDKENNTLPEVSKESTAKAELPPPQPPTAKDVTKPEPPKVDQSTTSSVDTAKVEGEGKPAAESKPLPNDKPKVGSDPLYKNGEIYPEDKSTTINKTSEMAPTTMPGTDAGAVKDLNSDPAKAVDKAAAVVGIDKKTLLAFAKIESSMRPGVKNTASSAKGLLQFTDATWDYAMGKHAAKFGIPKDAKPTDPYYSALLGAAYAKDNLKAMGDVASMGIRDDAAMYLGHHFGPGGGEKILAAFKADPNTPMQNAVSPQAFNSNMRELSGKTVGSYIEYLNGKITKAAGGEKGQQSTQVAEAATGKPVETKTEAQYGQSRPTIKPTPQINVASASSEATTTESQVYPVTPQPQNRPAIQQSGNMFTSFPGKTNQQPVQPTQAFNTENTEKLLGGMSDTLVAIKTVLEAIRDNGGMTDRQTEQPGKKSANPTTTASADEGKPTVTGPIGSAPPRSISTRGVSMSRKPISA